jgi:hypothetical protein
LISPLLLVRFLNRSVDAAQLTASTTGAGAQLLSLPHNAVELILCMRLGVLLTAHARPQPDFAQYTCAYASSGKHVHVDPNQHM